MIRCVLMVVMAAYLYRRVVRPLGWPVWWRAAVGGVLLAVALRDEWLRVLGGFGMAPRVPAWLLHGSAVFLVGFLVYFCAVFGVHAVCRLAPRVSAVWRRRAGESAEPHFIHCVHAVLVPLALGIGAVGVACGLALPGVRGVRIPLPAAAGLRIALLSDLHVSAARPPDYVRRIVQVVNEQKPDLVVITGDFVDGAPEDCAARLELLRELRAPLGVYGVSGNHDYYSGYARWRPLLSRYGVRMLDNEHVLLREHGPVLAGVTDESARYEHLEETNLAKALRGAPPGLPVLLLAHRPIIAREAAPAGVSLQLSGHLHGGLVWGLGAVVAAMDAGYRAGLYRVGGMQLYVSPGVGCSARTPLRLGVPGEVVILTLTE